jgi:hypothetical protein
MIPHGHDAKAEVAVPVIMWDWLCTDVHVYLPESTKDPHFDLCTAANVEKWFDRLSCR